MLELTILAVPLSTIFGLLWYLLERDRYKKYKRYLRQVDELLKSGDPRISFVDKMIRSKLPDRSTVKKRRYEELRYWLMRDGLRDYDAYMRVYSLMSHNGDK